MARRGIPAHNVIVAQAFNTSPSVQRTLGASAEIPLAVRKTRTGEHQDLTTASAPQCGTELRAAASPERPATSLDIVDAKPTILHHLKRATLHLLLSARAADSIGAGILVEHTLEDSVKKVHLGIDPRDKKDAGAVQMALRNVRLGEHEGEEFRQLARNCTLIGTTASSAASRIFLLALAELALGGPEPSSGKRPLEFRETLRALKEYKGQAIRLTLGDHTVTITKYTPTLYERCCYHAGEFILGYPKAEAWRRISVTHQNRSIEHQNEKRFGWRAFTPWAVSFAPVGLSSIAAMGTLAASHWISIAPWLVDGLKLAGSAGITSSLAAIGFKLLAHLPMTDRLIRRLSTHG